MDSNFIYKRFHELSLEELYEILRLRSAVFVVEQDAVYQDLDDLDQDALHLRLYKNGRLAAYARILKAGTYLDEVAIGRVIAVERGVGDGLAIFTKAIQIAQAEFGAERIKIRAQLQAKGFYEKTGFRCCGEPIMYEGLVHVDMMWSKE